MNGKAARKLRKIINTEAGFLPVTEYEDKRHTKLYFNGLNSDGSIRYEPAEVYTRELGKCQRALYQRAKRLHGQYAFH